MFVTALFVMAKSWKQPKCLNSLLNKCLKSGKKNCYIYTMEYSSAIKRNMNIDAHDNLDESP